MFCYIITFAMRQKMAARQAAQATGGKHGHGFIAPRDDGHGGQAGMGGREPSTGCRPTHTLRDTPPERRLRRSGQVSWLAGRHLFRPAFPAQQRQWTMDGGLAAHSCGGSLGFGAGSTSPNSLLAPGRTRRTSITADHRGRSGRVKLLTLQKERRGDQRSGEILCHHRAETIAERLRHTTICAGRRGSAEPRLKVHAARSAHALWIVGQRRRRGCPMPSRIRTRLRSSPAPNPRRARRAAR